MYCFDDGVKKLTDPFSVERRRISGLSVKTSGLHGGVQHVSVLELAYEYYHRDLRAEETSEICERPGTYTYRLPFSRLDVTISRVTCEVPNLIFSLLPIRITSPPPLVVTATCAKVQVLRAVS
jgi:hypothetical protein